MKLVAVILTFNESLHLARCINSVRSVADEVMIVDCFSTDSTLDIAARYEARVIQREWVNYATQFNWALKQLPGDTNWVLRIDADEYLTPELAHSIKENLPNTSTDIDGIYIDRRMTFQGRIIKYGGVFPVKVLRLFRLGYGECENRWMDEHVKVSGKTIFFKGELIDDNLNSLTWWIDKHNKYASREAIDLLNLEYNFMKHDSVADIKTLNQASVKRWVKEKVYSKLPLGLRSFIYFLYRYIIRLGFLDGKEGASFHFLQGFWYRYLVDSKILEVKRYIKVNNSDVVTAMDKVLGININQK